MPVAVGLFERYALGNVSAKDLADETGLAESGIRMILTEPPTADAREQPAEEVDPVTVPRSPTTRPGAPDVLHPRPECV